MLERSGMLRDNQDMPTKPKRPRDPNQLAHLIAAIATGEADDVKTDDGKNPAAVALGRKGGLKGGKARAASLTAAQLSAAAKKAAQARWSKDRKND
jgi:hypothetical protein